jgi:hypothetical protein
MKGVLLVDPPNVTRKHKNQSIWKRVAIIQFPGDETDRLWRWYMKSRYGLELNQPLRQSHVTIINDKFNDDHKWNEFKRKFNHTEFRIEPTKELRSNGEHWWLKVNSNPIIEHLRSYLNLGPPFFQYHLTIGLANERNIEHSKYIQEIITIYDRSINRT